MTKQSACAVLGAVADQPALAATHRNSHTKRELSCKGLPMSGGTAEVGKYCPGCAVGAGGVEGQSKLGCLDYSPQHHLLHTIKRSQIQVYCMVVSGQQLPRSCQTFDVFRKTDPPILAPLAALF